MSLIEYQKSDNGIVTLLFDREQSKINLVDQAFNKCLADHIKQLHQETDLKGVLLQSSKSTFIAGADLEALSQITESNQDQMFDMLNQLKSNIRKLETLPVPVVALLAGSALGGGLEVALSAHARIAVDQKHIKIGLPEVTLGLLPAGGGVSRLVRMLGLEKALPLLTEGKLMSTKAALKLGLIDELVADESLLIEAAIKWINQHPSPKKPWYEKGFKLPGGTANSPRIGQMLAIAPAMIKLKTHGCFPAPIAILSAAVEGSSVDIEASERIENRYFMELVKGPVSKNLIKTFFFDKKTIESGALRNLPETNEPFTSVGILGAGMMGAGIAWSVASNNMKAVLVDVTLEKADLGKAYSETLVQKKIKRNQLTEEKGQTLLDRISATDNFAELSSCDLIIEAVFEDRQLKAEVTQKALAHVKKGTLITSNTSTLPITGLADAVEDTSLFLGLHFFSPVDRMPLVEIIRGKQTSDTALAKAMQFVRQIRKVPIVANDSRGFFTSRVFKTFTYEGMAMLAEGVTAAEIENAAWLAGYPIGPLAVSDEVTLTLMDRIRIQTQKDLAKINQEYAPHPGDAALDRMLELNRIGKSTGAGFYDYPSDGKKQLWSGLSQQFSSVSGAPLQDLKDRLLYSQAIESIRVLRENVIEHSSEANIGSVLGFGFPAWTGGVIQFIAQTGAENFIERARILENEYGKRFAINPEWVFAALSK